MCASSLPAWASIGRQASAPTDGPPPTSRCISIQEAWIEVQTPSNRCVQPLKMGDPDSDIDDIPSRLLHLYRHCCRNGCTSRPEGREGQVQFQVEAETTRTIPLLHRQVAVQGVEYAIEMQTHGEYYLNTQHTCRRLHNLQCMRESLQPQSSQDDDAAVRDSMSRSSTWVPVHNCIIARFTTASRLCSLGSLMSP